MKWKCIKYFPQIFRQQLEVKSTIPVFVKLLLTSRRAIGKFSNSLKSGHHMKPAAQVQDSSSLTTPPPEPVPSVFCRVKPEAANSYGMLTKGKNEACEFMPAVRLG